MDKKYHNPKDAPDQTIKHLNLYIHPTAAIRFRIWGVVVVGFRAFEFEGFGRVRGLRVFLMLERVKVGKPANELSPVKAFSRLYLTKPSDPLIARFTAWLQVWGFLELRLPTVDFRVVGLVWGGR